jgi:trehalose 6-phosphate phosphatase
VRDPRGTALFLDFDGTLAPFVGASEDVILAADLLKTLTDLTARLGAVGVVSGRPVRFLRQVLPVPGLRLAGVYGLEEWIGGDVRDAPGVAAFLGELRAARDVLMAATASVDNVTVKFKRVSIVVHWRNGGPAKSDHVAELIGEIAASSGLRLQAGKNALELLPPVEMHKGVVVRRACRSTRATRLLYVGDDVGDLAAFNVARKMGGLAVAVDGPGDHAAPPAVVAAADLVLPDQRSVSSWLTELADALRTADGAPTRKSSVRGSS